MLWRFYKINHSGPYSVQEMFSYNCKNCNNAHLLLPPLPPRRLASLLAVHSPIRRGCRAPPGGLASGAASPESGLWAGTQTRRIRPQPPAHVSAGEESAGEPTSVIHFLGTQGISLHVCGAENHSQGTWEPGALRAELCLGGQGTAEGALLLPFASL